MLERYSVLDGRIAHSDAGTIPVDVYVMPDGEERAYLTDELGIDPHTLASSIDPDETPRIEFEDDYTAIILKYPKNYSADDNFLFRVKSMGIFLFTDRVVLVIDEEFPQLFTGKFATKVYTKQDVLLRVLTQTIRHFESHLRVINMCSDEIETQLNESYNSSNLLDMFTLEKSLVYYVNALSGNRRAFERIRVGAYKFQFTEENIELLDDLQIENRQFLDQAQVYSQILSGLVDARSNIINNNLNVLMKNMNAIVIAVAIPTFFTGV
ncbi:MAG: magnesium transporter CorA family protein, partial [Lentisphaeria bacterium]|nr:magnesium transporter CorA family protein [Lentisphaeria bacterium]